MKPVPISRTHIILTLQGFRPLYAIIDPKLVYVVTNLCVSHTLCTHSPMAAPGCTNDEELRAHFGPTACTSCDLFVNPKHAPSVYLPGKPVCSFCLKHE